MLDYVIYLLFISHSLTTECRKQSTRNERRFLHFFCFLSPHYLHSLLQLFSIQSSILIHSMNTGDKTARNEHTHIKQYRIKEIFLLCSVSYFLFDFISSRAEVKKRIFQLIHSLNGLTIKNSMKKIEFILFSFVFILCEMMLVQNIQKKKMEKQQATEKGMK